MVVARAEADGRVHILDRLRDPVRRRRPDPGPHAHAAPCGARSIAERLANGCAHAAARCARSATSTPAHNSEEFSSMPTRPGHPVEIISGREEARLIYLGVAHTSSDTEGRHFVIDSGGGSTECIIGERFDPISLHSLYMGCVGYTTQFFQNGALRRSNVARAQLAASLEFASLRESFRELGWSRSSGSSGTILAVSEVLRVNGWSHGEIHLDALRRLVQAIEECEILRELSLPGLEEDRAPVFPGGVAILVAAFEQLGLEVLEPERRASRGIARAADRPTHEDPRDAASRRSRRAIRSTSRRRSAEETAPPSSSERARLKSTPSSAPRASSGRGCTDRSRSPTPATSHSASSSEHGDMPGFSREVRHCWRVVGAHRRSSRAP
jgi:exopolyphosphatase/guanosine-5'-triphosphate,3'-diphosphate pyrophosphatase